MAIPIIVCGQTESIGSSVIQGLKPEIDVVFFHLSSGDAKAEISAALQGKAPADPASSLGSGQFSTPPKAVVLGAAYEADAVRSLRETVTGVSGVPSVPWLTFDRKQVAPPLGPEYGKHVVGRVKKAIMEMEKEGKLGDGHGDIYKY
ncbi:hypothetical protein LIA77_02029 [Sarocladium implicatum]|nr:hypothetical protein LIA77_02029 [Sarocladium implicatum]